MAVRGSAPGNKGHGTGGSAPEVDLCLHPHVHTCIYTLAHIFMLHTQIVIMFSGVMDRNICLWSCRVEVGVDFVLLFLG